MIKNLTKTQVEIEGLAGRVPKLTDKQKEWAMKNYAYVIGILGNAERECVCPNCHGPLDIPESKEDDTHKCPYCGAKLAVRRYYDSRGLQWFANGVMKDYHKERFFQVMSVVGDWQVTRLFYMERLCYVRRNNTPWTFYEVCQAWNSPKVGTTHFRSLPKKGIGCSWAYNPYSLHTWRLECTDPDNNYYNKYIECDNELEARRAGSQNYFNTDNICPIGKTISKSFKRMGLNATAFKSIKNLTAIGAMERLSGKNYKPMYETLLKGKDYAVFDHITERSSEDRAIAYFTAVKICKRNKYDYKSNITEWLDLMSFVIKRGLDYHNPHYVCPADIHAEHNHYLELERREEERREEQRRRARIERMHEQTKKDMKNKEKVEKEFVKRREMYFGLQIDSDLFTIVPLKSIDEFRYEGTYLDHCVFRCGYYKKESSLILSARDGHNNPIETIEINLNTFTIMQCYGVHDSHSALHDKIVKTMQENMWRVREIASGKKKKARVAA